MSRGNFKLNLGDPGAAAVFLIGEDDPAAIDALDESARASGALVLRTSLRDCRDKDDLLRRLADTFDLPDYFGHNWDALSDCLGDLEWLDARGYVLLLEHARELRDAARADFDTLIGILDEAADTWRDRDIAFFSFVDVAG